MKNLCTEEDNKAAVSQSCGAERNQHLLMFSIQNWWSGDLYDNVVLLSTDAAHSSLHNKNNI